MGLFSGSFGTGLVTGLATSIDKSLQSAMEKRDEEMSRARTFWETRQAQKMDLAEARDERAGKALDRLINEFGGDVAKGLAAYKGIGGDVESVEGYLTELDETRKGGLAYDLQEKINFDGIDLTEFADLTREQAMGSIRTEVKPLDVQMSDMSGLSKIGLGMEDMGKGISDKVNEMIPARTRQDIEGLTSAAVDRSGMIGALRLKTELQQAVPDLNNQLAANVLQLSTGKDLMGNDLSQADLAKIRSNQSAIHSAIAQTAISKAAGDTSGPTAAGFGSAYNSMYSKTAKGKGFDTVAGQQVITVNGEELFGDEAAAAWDTVITEESVNWVTENLLDAEGNFVSNDAEQAANLYVLGDYVDTARSRIEDAKGDEADTTATTTTEVESEPVVEGGDEPTGTPVGTGDATVSNLEELNAFIVNNPQDYVDGILATGKTVKPDVLLEKLVRAGVDAEVAAGIIAPLRKTETPAVSVPPKPKGIAGATWESKYGKTHNPDGSPKGQ